MLRKNISCDRLNEEQTEGENMQKFDDKNIVFSFAVMTDVHMCDSMGFDSRYKLKNAIDYTNEISARDGRKLDAYCFVGDTLDRGLDYQAKMFGEVMLDNIKDNQKIFYCMGNHERLNHDEKAAILSIRKYLGEKYYEYDEEGEEEFLKGFRITHMGGHLFFAIQSDDYDAPIKFNDDTLDYIDKKLSEECKKNPDKYIFMFNHSMCYGTCYGSDLDGPDSLWNNTQLERVLKKYPNVVIFGGHLHFPLNDERTIMQTDFTSIGAGCVTYMACENGNYEFMSGRTTMRDMLLFSQNLLCELDSEGNLKIRRLDCFNKWEIKEPWILESPKQNREHLEKYTFDRGNDDNNKAPSMKGCSGTINEESDYGKVIMRVTFESGTDDDLIHHYELDSYENGEFVKQRRVLSDFYKHRVPSDMRKSYTFRFADKEEGKRYGFKIRAVDSWGKKSEEIVVGDID